MRMMRIEPQPDQVGEHEYHLQVNELSFYFDWPYLDYQGNPDRLFLAGPLTPDLNTWELKRISGVWYWVQS